MKSMYFVSYGISESSNRRGEPICLSNQEIVEIVKPLSKDVKRVIKNDKISIISSDGRKFRQAASIIGKELGVRPVFRDNIDKGCNDSFSSIIKLIPPHRKQIILLGIDKIESVIESFMDQTHKDFVHRLANVTADKQFCPYEVWQLDITDRNLNRAKTLIIN